jgi:hypothetical protein
MNFQMRENISPRLKQLPKYMVTPEEERTTNIIRWMGLRIRDKLSVNLAHKHIHSFVYDKDT